MLQSSLKSLVNVINCNERRIFCLSMRSAGTFVSMSGKQLWASTSPEIRRTGRGKRSRVRKKEDFSAGHLIGEGEAGIRWPGLNEKIHEKAVKRTPEEQEEFLKQIEESKHVRKLERPKLRGWTGGHYGGVRLGPPESVEGANFDGFESVVMDVARVSHMNKKVGRVYSMRAMIAVGNSKGLVGVASSVAPNSSTAFRKARQKAINRLVHVERLEERTVYEDLYINHHHTWLLIRKQPEGYGLRCHRALKDMCKLVGFRDLYIKVIGSTTTLNMLKCFIKGVLSQETFQQKADRLGYHVVEYDQQFRNYPRVLASPSGHTKNEEHNDYDDYLNQELITRDVRVLEKGLRSPFSKVITSDNRGAPTPPSLSNPDFLARLRDLKIE